MDRLQSPPVLTPQVVRPSTEPRVAAPPQAQQPVVPSANPPVASKDQVQMSTQGSANASLSFAPEPEYTLHTVKRGENLGEIAKKYLGNTNRHMEIYEINRDDLRNPNDLRIGMALKIPVPPAPQAPEPQQPTLPAVTAPGAPATPTTPAAEPAYKTHTVKRGESLSTIALRTLGDSERYMEIYQANRDQLKTPDALQLGMTLKIPPRNPNAVAETRPQPRPNTPVTPAAPVSGVTPVDATGLTAGAQELLTAMQRYQQHHAELGNTGRTQTTPAQLREIAVELDAAGKAFGVDPKMMLALYAHESGGINPRARSHTGAGGLGQLTGIAIRQVHFMAGIGKGNKGSEPFTQHKSNFVQSTTNINQRYNIKANVWTTVAYMSYELNDRASLGRGVEKALKRYGDPNVSTYANKVSAEYKTLFGGKLF